jgi:putative SOS response-associated peptidase YedK
MCVKATSPSIEELIEYISSQPGYTVDEAIRPYYFADGFDFPKLPVSIQGFPQKVIGMRWGLLPKWFDLIAARRQSVQKQIAQLQAKGRMLVDTSLIRPKSDEKLIAEFTAGTLNARSDEVFNKPSWRDSIMQRRCIIYTKGFYEPKHINGGEVKIPCFIYPKKDKILTFGGLWSSWKHPDTGAVSHSMAIITVDANELLSEIHHKQRMPLILDKSQASVWLSTGLNRNDIESLMQPCADNLLGAFTVSNIINQRIPSAQKNTPIIQERHSYPEWIAE